MSYVEHLFKALLAILGLLGEMVIQVFLLIFFIVGLLV